MAVIVRTCRSKSLCRVYTNFFSHTARYVFSHPQVSFLSSPPSFCYVLQASVTRPWLTVTEAVRERLPSVSHERASDTTRLDLLGRVLHYSQEVSDLETTVYRQGRIKRRGHATVHEQKLYGRRNDTKYSCNRIVLL